MRPRRWFSIVLLISATFSSVSAQTTSAASTTSIQNSSGPAFDVRAAVDAYLATVRRTSVPGRMPTLKAVIGFCSGISFPQG